MAREPIFGAGVPTGARNAGLVFCCALALVPGAWAQSLPWLLNPNAGLEASAKVTFRYPWGSFEVETAPVRPSDAATVVVFPGDGSDESWRRISRQLSAVLGKLPGGEAEAWLLDGSTARGLGKLSRRTPAQRLIPIEARTVVISGGSEASAAAVQPVDADPADAQAETQAAGTFTPGMQAQAIEWLEGEPRGWALSIWLVPETKFDGESRDFLVARLLRAAARSQTRLRFEIPGTEPNAARTALPNGLPMDLAETELLAVFRPERDVRLADAPEMSVALLPPVPFPQGFHLHRLGVKSSDSAGVPAMEIELPWLSVAEGTAAPDRSLFERVSYLERRLLGMPVANPAGEDVQSGAEPGQKALLAEAAHTVRSTLELNPAAFEVLRAGAAIARAMGHPATAVDYEARRLPAEPPQLDRLETLGLAAYDALQLGLAKRLLTKAASLESANAAVWKALAVLSAVGGADPEALSQSARSLALKSKQADLHLLRADVFARQNLQPQRAEELLAAGKSGEVPVERRLEAVEVLQQLNRLPESAEALPLPVDALPESAGVLERFALAAEKADVELQRSIAKLSTGHPGERKEGPLAAASLTAWKRLLAMKTEGGFRTTETTSPFDAPASLDVRLNGMLAVARLHFMAGRDAESAAMARAGLQAEPESAPLLLALTDALQYQDKTFEARRELHARATVLNDRRVIERLATLEDAEGGEASSAYRRLLETGEGTEGDRSRWRERGLHSARKQGNLEAIRWFEEGKEQPVEGANEPGSFAEIRGGLKAVFELVGSDAVPDAPRFLESISRVIHNRTSLVVEEQRKAYKENGRDLLRALDRLLVMGDVENGTAMLHLRSGTKEQTQTSARWLKELAVELRWRSGRAQLVRGTKEDGARGQMLAKALGIDLLEMEDAVREGRPLEIRIPVERAPMLLKEADWRAAWGGGNAPGGFAGFLLENPEAATLYHALSQMEPGAREALVSTLGLRGIAERHGQLLLLHGASLHVAGGTVVTPGGEAAAPHWRSLIKADPGQPAAFLEALLRRDDGDALVFYSLVASVDLTRQRFLTASAGRLAQFYRAFRETPALRGNQAREIDQPIPMDYVRELPIDSDGKLLFPGSAELWMVIRGNAESPKEIARRAKRLAKTTAPEQEDAILIRLLKDNYVLASHYHGLYENFLAVARMDARRRELAIEDARIELLDEDSAFLLAEMAGSMRPLYGVLAELPYLSADDFRRVLTIASRFTDGSPEHRNAEAGQFYGMLALCAWASSQRTIPPDRIAEALRRFLAAFPDDREPAAAARATLRALRELASPGTGGRSSVAASDIPIDDPGLALYALLAPWIVERGDLPRELHRRLAEESRRRYQALMDAQTLPAISVLLAAEDALRRLGESNNDPQKELEVLSAALAGLPDMPAIPKGMASERESNLKRYQVFSVREALNKLKGEIARGSGAKRQTVRPDRVNGFSGEVLEALSPQVTLALSGLLYARFFHPDDLLVAEDPLFIRRHEYIPLREVRKVGVVRSAMEKVGGPDGSLIIGGFEGMARLAGISSAESGVDHPGNTEQLLMAELAAFRATNWLDLSESGSQQFARYLQAARDWVVVSVDDPKRRDALAQATYGRIANARRASLLKALESADWHTVWQSLSTTDLLRLAITLRSGPPLLAPSGGSPVQDAPDHRFLAALGAPLDLLQNRIVPGFAELPPYEDISNRPFPALAVSRLAEAKVYFAEQLARRAQPAAAMAAFAEEAIRRILSNAKITGPLDWQAVLETYRNIRPEDLASGLEEGSAVEVSEERQPAKPQ